MKKSKKIASTTLAVGAVAAVVMVANIEPRRIVCPTPDSVLHSAAGQHPVGTEFQCMGTTPMHCDAQEGHDTAVSTTAEIECTPIIEFLRVVPEPSGILMLVMGILTLGVFARLRRNR
jgi:hypothetical protein